MSCTVSQSVPEMALRLALGANNLDLLRLIMWHGAELTAGALALGAVAAFGLTNLLGDMLYSVSLHDPLSFAAAFGLFAVASVASCLIRAWRAMRIAPIIALKG
jgi:putative ABC transport system permease protein